MNSANNKRIAKNTILLYFRMLITMLVGLYTSRIVLATLGIEDYGLYNVVGGIVVVLSFLNGAMASSTQRYLNYELGVNNLDGLKKVYTTSMIIHIGVAVATILLAETIGLVFLNTYMNISPDRIGAANWVYQFSIATFVLNVISVPYNATIIAHEKMSAFAYISIVEVMLKLIVAVLISHAPFDALIYYALLILIVGLIVRFIYGYYCRRYFEECRIEQYKVDCNLLKSMLSFSTWTIFGNLAFIFHTQGVAIVVNMFFGVAVNAAQGISNQVNSIVSGFVQNFMTAMKPQVVKSYAMGNIEDLHRLVLTGSRFSFFLVLLFVVPLTLEAPFFLSVWLKEVPEYTVIFIRLILFVTLFDSFNSLLNAAKGATGNIKKYMIVQTSISIMHLPVSWILFKIGYAPYYTLFVYLVLVVIMQITRIWFVCRAINLSMKKFYMDVVARCLLVMSMAYLFPYTLYYYMQTDLWGVVIVCLFSVVSCILSISFLGLKKYERVSVLTMIHKKLNLNKSSR